MNTELEPIYDTMTFGALKEGSPFVSAQHDECVYLKTKLISQGEFDYNAVRLDQGTFAFFADNADVVEVECKGFKYV